jgi:Spy/CpxP family protein refolding chaperone
MKRGWFIILALSIGLNAGLLFVQLSKSADDRNHALPGERAGRRMESMGPIGHPDGPPGFMRDRLERVGDRLNLSEEQVESMSAILKDVMPEMLEGREAIRGLRLQMREEYLRPDVNENRIQELRRETATAQSRLDSIMVDTMLKEAKLLTPEQREAYFELMPFGDRGGAGGREKTGGRMRRGHR